MHACHILMYLKLPCCYHRNLLKVGICQLHMWPMNGENSPENLTNGPIANNPDISAVLLTIEFENFACPIIFPSGTPSEILDYANPRYI